MAQYVSWADSSAYNINTIKIKYDLSKSEMKPSMNPEQPTRADFWIGTTSFEGTVPIIFGVTFNAGTMEANKDLANGTTREWFLYYEEISLASGLTNATQKPKTLGEAVGVSTWNKAKGIWETKNVFDISVKFAFSSDTNENFKIILSVTNDTVSKTLVKDYEKKLARGNFRYTYGLNYTPEIGENRKVSDITNGGYFVNIIQVQVQGYQNNDLVKAEMGFVDGRVKNGARQVGIYGSDVLTAKKRGTTCVLDFRY